MQNQHDAPLPATKSVAWRGEVISIHDERAVPVDWREAGVSRRSLVTAFRDNPNVNIKEESAFALTYALSPSHWMFARDVLKHDMLSPRRPSAMRVETMEVDVFAPAVMLGHQARTSTDPSAVEEPRIIGELNDAGQPIACLTMQFNSLDHLHDWTRHVVKTTDAAGADYRVSIIEKGVSEPITLIPVTVVLLDAGDGNPGTFTAWAAWDGITRLIRSVQVHLGDKVRIDDVADWFVEHTVNPTKSKRTPTSLHERMMERRNDAVTEWRTICTNARIKGAGSTDVERGVRTAQALTIRARVVLGAHSNPTTDFDPVDQFPEAVAELVRFTQENKAWRQEANAANAMHTVVRALKGSDIVTTSDQADFLLGRTGLDDLPKVTADLVGSTVLPSKHLAALFRGVYLIWFLTREPTFRRAKAELRTTIKAGLIRDTHFAAMAAPLIEVPWRQRKASGLSVARNAYKSRGAFTDDAMGKGWSPVIDAPMELYRKAIDGDEDARVTLMTGGGIALIAERFLGTEVTAGTASGGSYKSPWGKPPSSIQEVVALLGHVANRRGLLQLALAMDSFDLEREAVNGLATLERGRRVTPDTAEDFYTVKAAADDLFGTQSDGIMRVNGSEVELTTDLLLLIADYDGSRARKASGAGGEEPDKPETVQTLTDKFIDTVAAAAELAKDVIEKSKTDPSHPVVDAAIQKDLGRNQRTIVTHVGWVEDNAVTEVEPLADIVDLLSELDDAAESLADWVNADAAQLGMGDRDVEEES